MLNFVQSHLSGINFFLAAITSSLLALNGFRALTMWIDSKGALLDLYFAVKFEDKIQEADGDELDDLKDRYKKQKESAMKRTEEVMNKKYSLFSLSYFKVDPSK